MRLIDADKEERRIEYSFCNGCEEKEDIGCAYCGAKIALTALTVAETVDAVEVVRCKDCAERAILGDPDENRRYCAHLGFRVEDEGFCSDGRRASDRDHTDDC